MILKLELNGKIDGGWELISDITCFKHFRLDEETAINLDESLELFDFIETKTDKKLSYVYIQAWCKRQSAPIYIITNKQAFMLNDEGKTIERIN